MRILIAILVLGTIAFAVYRRMKSSASTPDAPKFANLDEQMRWLANEAIDMTKREHGEILDYSTASIQSVEKVLGKLHDDVVSGKLREGQRGLAIAYGAYVGECIRRAHPPAHWELDHDIGGAGTYPLFWKGGCSFPVSWCYKRIMNGEEDNIWFKFEILRDDRLRDATTTNPS